MNESESRGALRQLLTVAGVGLWVFDADGRLASVTGAGARSLGFEPRGLAGRPLEELLADGPAAAEPTLADLRAGRAVPHAEVRVRRADGKAAWLHLAAVPRLDGHGAHAGFMAVTLDVTQATRARRGAQQALLRRAAESERLAGRLRLHTAALESAANGVVITDREGVIEWVNPAFTALTGFPAEEAVGLRPSLLKSGRQDREFYRALWATITAGRVWHGEVVNRRADGSLYEEEMTIAPVADADGPIHHFVAIKQDVTERNRARAEALRSERLRALGQLAAGVAHDLGNSLTPILAGVEALRREPMRPEAIEALSDVRSGAERARGLVLQILAFARGDSPQRAPLRTEEVLGGMARLVRKTFPPAIEVRTSWPDRPWPLLADPLQLHQVLLNLCVNARDAMPRGGVLELAASHVPPSGRQLGLERLGPGNLVALRVADTGTGIPPEHLERVFEPFFTTKGDRGTGLGLSIVQRVVEAHGGAVRVESRPGAGTEFQVYLPAAEEGERATRP